MWYHKMLFIIFSGSIHFLWKSSLFSYPLFGQGVIQKLAAFARTAATRGRALPYLSIVGIIKYYNLSVPHKNRTKAPCNTRRAVA